jgi:outer membrane protein assembly factor BamB
VPGWPAWAILAGIAVTIALAALAAGTSDRPTTQSAAQILEATGVKGGLVVHVGCGDGRLTAGLRASDSYLVQGLDTDAERVKQARAHIRSRGEYGNVSVAQFDGKRLPYIDGLVNLVVAEDLGGVPMSEVMRVLCPGGVAYVRGRDEWTKTVKPWPDDIDEWTHWRHDAAGNPVAHDTVVGPPRRMQWTGGPKWARHHDHMASLSAMVSAGGRIFYIIDEGPKASIQLPPRWVLAARDAFNGTVLWKREIDTWYNHLFPLKSGPALLPRRMVAVGDRVYVTVGIDAPVSELDAATGETLQTYEGTKTVEEVLYSDGMLLLVVNPERKLVDYRQEDAHCWTERDRASRRWGWHGEPRVLMGVKTDTGERAWQQTSPVVPLSLATDGRHVIFHDGETVVCLDRASGDELWRSEPLAQTGMVPTGWSPTTVLYDGVVLYSGQKQQLVALSAEDGRKLWQAKLHPSGHFCPEDVMVIDGLVWSGDIASSWQRSKGTFTGRDPRTGEVKSEFPPDTDPHAVMHQRCHPSKGTDRYILTSWLGIEFIDPKTEHW